MIARAIITKAITTYMMPIRLWSTVVSHRNQSGDHSRNQVRPAVTTSTPRITMEAAAEAMML